MAQDVQTSAHRANASSVTLNEPPREGQKVIHNGKTLTTVKEGLAYILVPEGLRTFLDQKAAKTDPGGLQSVFYNPVQQFNRDLSVLAIRAYGEDLMAFRQQKVEAREFRGTKRKRHGGEDVAKALHSDGLAVRPEAHHSDSEGDHSYRLEANEDGKSIDSAHMPENDERNGKGSTGHVRDFEKRTGIAEGTTEAQSNGASISNQVRGMGKFRILDALSATGLRALRYSHEIPFVTSVTANDLSRHATDSINLNIKHNKLDEKIKSVTGNAMSLMYSLISHPNKDPHNTAKYDVIDLDPYGTAVPFLDGAVQAVSDGGLLCVTCTDAGVWASCGYPEKTYSLYGGTPLKGLHSHEGGLRLILHAIASSAARYGLSIEPLLSLSIDFYARVFVRVFQSPMEVKMLAGKTMLVYNCDHGCGAWETQFLARNQTLGTKNGQTAYKHSIAQGPTASIHCDHCGMKTHMSGPMWGGPIHNPAFIQTILEQLPTLDKAVYVTTDRLEGMLTTALEETLLCDYKDSRFKDTETKDKPGRLVPRNDPVEADRSPFYFVPSALAKVLHCRAPSEADVRGALKHAGYAVTRSHARPGTIKTNAPWSFIWAMMREWTQQKAPIKEGAVKPGTAGWGILHGNHGNARGKPTDLGGAPVSADLAVENPRNEAIASTTSESGRVDQSETKQQAATGAVNAEEKGSPAPVKIVFDGVLGKEVNKRRVKRYQENPRAHWGPMNRAKGPNKHPAATIDK